MTTTLNEYQLRRTGTRFGAEINGIDLRVPVSEGIRESLVRDFREHKVLVFRGQHLSPDQQVDAVRIFDEPFDHPTAVRHSENPLVYPYDVKTTGKASTWHIGGLWRNPPFSIESLVFEEVSELGGNTLWADLQAAYDDLSEPYKELLEEYRRSTIPILGTMRRAQRRERSRQRSNTRSCVSTVMVAKVCSSAVALWG